MFNTIQNGSPTRTALRPFHERGLPGGESDFTYSHYTATSANVKQKSKLRQINQLFDQQKNTL